MIPSTGGSYIALHSLSNLSAPVIVIGLTDEQIFDEETVLEEESKDRLVWIGWHPLSATDSHLVTLSERGMLTMHNIVNGSGKIELRMRVRSPEDYSLRCATATLEKDTLLVAMGNGDLLAICPLLPFPCFLDKDDEELKHKFSEFFSNGEIGENGIMKRSPRSFIRKSPTVQGPLLIQPEPIASVNPHVMLFSFNFCVGVKLIALVSDSNCLDLMMLDEPFKIILHDEEGEEQEDGDRCAGTLTLLETLILSGIQKIYKMTFIEEENLLLIGHNDGIDVLDLKWLAKLLEGGKYEDVDLKSSRRVLLNDPKISNFCVSGLSVYYVRDSGVAEIMSLNQAKEWDFDNPLSVFGRKALPINLRKLPALNLPKIPKLPALKIPSSLAKTEFCQFNEDTLEFLAKAIDQWRTEVLLNCAAFFVPMKGRVAMLKEIAQKQKVWADTLLFRTNKVITDLEENLQLLANTEKRATLIFERLGQLNIFKGCAKQVDELACSLQMVQKRVNEVIESTEEHHSYQLVENLKVSTLLLDRIQERIKDISISDK